MTAPSETLLRAAGLLPEDGEQAATLSLDIPIEDALRPIEGVLGEILTELQKLNARLHRIEANTHETVRAVVETASRGVA